MLKISWSITILILLLTCLLPNNIKAQHQKLIRSFYGDLNGDKIDDSIYFVEKDMGIGISLAESQKSGFEKTIVNSYFFNKKNFGVTSSTSELNLDIKKDTFIIHNETYGNVIIDYETVFVRKNSIWKLLSYSSFGGESQSKHFYYKFIYNLNIDLSLVKWENEYGKLKKTKIDFDNKSNIQFLFAQLKELQQLTPSAIKSVTKKFSEYLNNCFNINKANVNTINDIAFLFLNANNFEVASLILNSVIESFPNRVVAYLNLGDAEWGLNEIENAKRHYKKYIVLMKEQNKDLKKIPTYVYERMR